MSWTQPVCDEHYALLHPDREPVRVNLKLEEYDKCCFCLLHTNIYVRLDPKIVPYPKEEVS